MPRYLRATGLVIHILLAFVLLIITGSIFNNKTRLVKSTKRWWLNTTTKMIGVQIRIQGSIPDIRNGEGMLFISNHVSWLDIPVIGGLTQINFLSKAEVKQWPLIGKLAESTGTLFIRRGTGDADAIAGKMAEYINQGRSVLFFPEGTTSDGSKVKRFHPKLFRVTQHISTQLCPVAIHYRVEGEPGNPVAFIGDDEFTEHLWRLLGFRQITATVTFLPAVDLKPDAFDAGIKLIRQDIETVINDINRDINTNIQSPGASTPADPHAEVTSF